MSVIIKIIGANENSDEYRCAERMKSILESGFPDSAMGEIILHPNATLLGQVVKDVDLLMMGTLQNFSLPLEFQTKDEKRITASVEIISFCTVVEIKAHRIQSISREGTELFVEYREGKHAVTKQSNAQKNSAMLFFKRALGISPYVTNMIWLTGVTQSEIKSLLKTGAGIIPASVLPGNFRMADFMQLLAENAPPFCIRGKWRIDAMSGKCSPETLSRQFQVLAQAKKQMGSLTRQRIEQITGKSVSGAFKLPDGKKLIIYRGKAGTGKTIGLLRTAIRLVDEQDARVLMLTYNRALVSDIRRLLCLAELPDLFDEKCIHIQTIHAYFYRLINAALYDGTLSGEDFLHTYPEKLAEMTDLLRTCDAPMEFLRELMGIDMTLLWDYCLIDEGQDWTNAEKDLILQLFDAAHVIVADGGQQFVRSIDCCSWNLYPERATYKLKVCLRQKHNLVSFINHLTEVLDPAGGHIQDTDHLPGGKVVLVLDKDRFWETVATEKAVLKQDGNILYDMLFLVPSSLVERSPRKFARTEDFLRHDLPIWDATQTELRGEYPVLGDAARVLQYESARGLEGWTVFCLDFDRFVQEKEMQFQADPVENSLLLESEEETRKRFMLNWILIPLTRAIDTLVITVEDSDSEIARTLRELAHNYPDYIILK